jgi:hypothetical protein
LWEIAQELNRDKFLSNKALSNISHDLTKIKARRNIKAFERVRQIILKASTEESLHLCGGFSRGSKLI